MSGAIMISFFLVRRRRNVRSLDPSSSRMTPLDFSQSCCKSAVWRAVDSSSSVERMARHKHGFYALLRVSGIRTSLAGRFDSSQKFELKCNPESMVPPILAGSVGVSPVLKVTSTVAHDTPQGCYMAHTVDGEEALNLGIHNLGKVT